MTITSMHATVPPRDQAPRQAAVIVLLAAGIGAETGR
jgi:hypothetical protein